MADIERTRSWLIYGQAGTGKTTLASTFPGPALLVDIKDHGTDSVSDVKGLKVLEVTEWSQLEDLYWHLKDNPEKFKTVIIDTVTQAQGLLIEEILEGQNLKGKMPGDWGTMRKQDWGTVASELKSWITDMRDLDMDVVFLAQSRTFNVSDDESEEGAIDPEVGPNLTPSTMNHLCAAVSMIGNTFIREKIVKKKVKGKTIERSIKEYCIRLGPSPYYITKLRKPRSIELPDFLSDPTFDDLIELIQGD